MLDSLKCFVAEKRALSSLNQSVIQGIIFKVCYSRNQGYCIALSDFKNWLLTRK